MKADFCGTVTEQKRHRMGWITATERKNKASAGELKSGHKTGEKCMCCAHLNPRNTNHCDLDDIATRANCYCKEFKDREAA